MPELRDQVARAGNAHRRQSGESRRASKQGRAVAVFDQSLRGKDADRALRCAARMRRLSLDRALLLTLLLADLAHPRYQASARRFIVRFTIECETSLVHVKRLADALAHLHHPHFGPYAREGLDNLVAKLRARERDVESAATSETDPWVEFNSLPE